ncbi:MAG: WXG100 family type VII secretion target [Clostridiales bacterium]|nr:WXG100 family type VII secretion target [Clostridiales bacterium]
MTGTLKVDTATLRNVSSTFSSLNTEVSNLTAQMLTLISGINGAVWSGEAASSYQSKFAALDSDMTRIKNMIQEHVDDLVSMADEFDAAEEAAQTEASALRNDVLG